MLIFPLAIFVTTLVLSLYTTRKIIYISHKKHLFDEPTENRKIHTSKTPNLGGVAMFAALTFSASVFLPWSEIARLNYFIAAAVILFAVGLTDDFVGVNPTKKMLAQVFVALIITLLADLRFTGLNGLFGIHDLPYSISILLSVLFILLTINAFNLIDGINCLAGSLGLLACIVFASSFAIMKESGFMYIALALAGCLLGFLYFNRTPARIFMGDTGSLFIGFIVSIFTIRFMELSKLPSTPGISQYFKAAPAQLLSVLIIPVFDTLRVFFIRIRNGRSPFYADRNHLHHRLIDLKFSHLQATGILVSVNMLCVIIAFAGSMLGIGSEWMIGTLIAFVLILNQLSANWAASKKKQLIAAEEEAAILDLTRRQQQVRVLSKNISGQFKDQPAEEILQ